MIITATEEKKGDMKKNVLDSLTIILLTLLAMRNEPPGQIFNRSLIYTVSTRSHVRIYFN